MSTGEVVVPGVEAVDGRTRRGERTRAAIVEALLQLIHEGDGRPTARQIAARAGVSVRSIFQHFDDLEGLYGDLVRVQAARVQPLVDALAADGDLEQRVAALALQRAELFEAIRPVRHAVGTRERTSPVIARRIHDLSDALFAQVREQFAAELSGPDGEELALAADVMASFETWDRLREQHDLDPAEAEAVLARSVRRLLRS